MEFKVFAKKLLKMCNSTDCEKCKLDKADDCMSWCLNNPEQAEHIVKDWYRANNKTIFLEL